MIRVSKNLWKTSYILYGEGFISINAKKKNNNNNPFRCLPLDLSILISCNFLLVSLLSGHYCPIQRCFQHLHGTSLGNTFVRQMARSALQLLLNLLEWSISFFFLYKINNHKHSNDGLHSDDDDDDDDEGYITLTPISSITLRKCRQQIKQHKVKIINHRH